MGRKIPVFVKGGAPKNNTDTSHGISVFSYGIYPTEFYGIDCLIPHYWLHIFFIVLAMLWILEYAI